jgi:hypothetical protein
MWVLKTITTTILGQVFLLHIVSAFYGGVDNQKKTCNLKYTSQKFQDSEQTIT